MCRSEKKGGLEEDVKLNDFNILATLQNTVALKWHGSHGVSYQSSRASSSLF
jgi:hypothetical protein